MKKERNFKNVYSFHLSYSKGYAINSNIIYEMIIDKKTNNCIVKIKPYGISIEDTKEIIADNCKINELINILNKYHIDKWDGFNKSNKDVLDGDDFCLSIWMNDNKSIHASGYMMWPDRYGEFILDIDEFFMNIYNKEGD